MLANSSTVATASRPVPAQAGIGLRADHHADLLARGAPVGWLEAHTENYLAAGGPQRRVLDTLRRDYPISLHGVGLSLGSADCLDVRHLSQVAAAVERYQPALVSEHLCWGAIGRRHFNDLLPMPLTREALSLMVSRVAQVQDLLGRQMLIENVSSYLAFTGAEMTEPEFLVALARQSGCGLLLDVNNVYVSAHNHGFDARAFLQAIPPELVGELHLAGHATNDCDGRRILVDSHDRPVCAAVWDLYAVAIERFPQAPTLIEWDSNLPPLDELVAEAHRADAIRSRTLGLAA
jgi:hypothetical protein